MILERDYGAPGGNTASVEIIDQFIDGKLSAISACLMLEAAGLKVPDTMRQYFGNEVALATHIPFDSFDFNSPPKQLPKS